MLLVGSYVGLSKALVAVLPVFLLAWLRFGIAAVAMLPWLRRAAGEAPLTTGDRRLLFVESFFGNFLFTVCMLFGVAQSSALAAGVVMAAIPGVVALMSWLMLGERVAPRVAAGIGCAIAGIALVTLDRESAAQGAAAIAATGAGAGAGVGAGLGAGLGAGVGAGAEAGASAVAARRSGGGSGWGLALLVGAVCCEALYVVVGKKLSGRLAPRRISALINLWGLALVTPFGVWQAIGYDFGGVAASAWLLLVFYAIAASVVTVLLWMTGLKRVPATSAGVFSVMLPVGTAAVGALFLGERFSVAQMAAYALALSGVVLATWPAKRRLPPEHDRPHAAGA